ncbi:hypothetical protein CDAR_257961 [Caerostris darwini]|uniref:Uncharacterized protein n=1 Tax=Caerostris darwini TaxID=1538125 RepID=A0AAV4WVT9_9ARAC|nr:hypothetical protein CDAR_257961 [Caerostris darwini]
MIILGKRSKRSTTVANPSRSHLPLSLPPTSSKPFSVLPHSLPLQFSEESFPPPSLLFLSEDSIAFDSGSQRYEKDQDSVLPHTQVWL